MIFAVRSSFVTATISTANIHSSDAPLCFSREGWYTEHMGGRLQSRTGTDAVTDVAYSLTHCLESTTSPRTGHTA